MWISIKAYAAEVSCTERHVRNLIAAGKVEVRDIGVSGRRCLRINYDPQTCGIREEGKEQ